MRDRWPAQCSGKAAGPGHPYVHDGSWAADDRLGAARGRAWAAGERFRTRHQGMGRRGGSDRLNAAGGVAREAGSTGARPPPSGRH